MTFKQEKSPHSPPAALWFQILTGYSVYARFSVPIMFGKQTEWIEVPCFLDLEFAYEKKRSKHNGTRRQRQTLHNMTA